MRISWLIKHSLAVRFDEICRVNVGTVPQISRSAIKKEGGF